jgi:hypothetical protein
MHKKGLVAACVMRFFNPVIHKKALCYECISGHAFFQPYYAQEGVSSSPRNVLLGSFLQEKGLVAAIRYVYFRQFFF